MIKSIRTSLPVSYNPQISIFMDGTVTQKCNYKQHFVNWN